MTKPLVAIGQDFIQEGWHLVQNTLTSTEVISALHMKPLSLDIIAQHLGVHGVGSELQDDKEHPEPYKYLCPALQNVALGG